MEKRHLGRTGVKVSKLCLGCMNFGGRTPEAESMAIIDRAIDGGINFLDTANVYSSGASETTVGKALQRNGHRHRVVLATKVHGRMADDDVNATGSHRRHLVEQCEASLKRLQTDTIDLYQMHRPRSDTPIDETLRALDDLVRAGKVRYVGTSNFAAWQLMESLWAAKVYGLNRFVSEQPPYHLLDRSIERELIQMARTYGLAILPWSPLARGFLTGRYPRRQEAPFDARLERDIHGSSQFLHNRAQQHFSERAYDVLDVVTTLAGEKSCTPAQAALAWVAAQPGITCPIIGPRTMDQLADNLGAADITFSEEDFARVDAVAPPERAIVSYRNGAMTDFRPAMYRW